LKNISKNIKLIYLFLYIKIYQFILILLRIFISYSNNTWYYRSSI